MPGSMLEALQYEREGYVNRGLTDRVRQVDDAIRALTGAPAADNDAPAVDIKPAPRIPARNRRK